MDAKLFCTTFSRPFKKLQFPRERRTLSTALTQSSSDHHLLPRPGLMSTSIWSPGFFALMLLSRSSRFLVSCSSTFKMTSPGRESGLLRRALKNYFLDVKE